MESLKPFWDLGIAASLVVALALVYGFDRNPASNAQQSSEPSVETVTVPDQKPVKLLRLAVTEPPEFDNMGALLNTLGQGYNYQPIRFQELLDRQKLAEFDVIFLTCGGVPREWLGERLGDGPRAGTVTYTALPEVMEKLKENLREFVGNGGTLYASDWQFQLVMTAFPERAVMPEVGREQTLTANVVDPGLQQQLGDEIELRFDMSDWYPATFRESGPNETDLSVYLRGTYVAKSGSQIEAPLLVKFPYQQGSVIFTSFHNEKQNSELETKLLKYLVFAAVTARTDADITRTLVKGGFSPANRSLLSASNSATTVTQTYQCEKVADTQFVLGFENQGATLKLTVVGPDGKTLEKRGTSTLTIDVPQAATGTWKYTVTAEKVPYENFPFTLTIGQK